MERSMYKAKTANTSSGAEDMVMLTGTKIGTEQIVENLRKRYNEDLIYTYIGPILVAVNPYKSLPYFTEREIETYQGAAPHEHPPHIYAIADVMYRNMLYDEDPQCVIISGESGAGKTESAKLIMSYISAISGKGSEAVENVKRIILESNPLLESFGNAKTLRNNNSSRFGKYFEIRFVRGSGQPDGGTVSNFLLEKSRIVSIKPGERNFHIFYQITKGATPQDQENLGMAGPEYFWYLSQSQTYDADGIDDVQEYADCKRAMGICGIEGNVMQSIYQIVAGVLHLGNIQFTDRGNNAVFNDPSTLDFPSYLLGVQKDFLSAKLTSRLMQTGAGVGGKRGTLYDVPLNSQQSVQSRDALSKALYSRMFDYIVQAVNRAISRQSQNNISLGVLDIFGFEIFEQNGFEQLCINYVNEKLQQIFIELTLKSEQEEYVREGIQWTPINFFNNKIVVDLLESKRPVGVMPILDDVCATMHAVADGADSIFIQKLGVIQNQHYQGLQNAFVIQHYAGQVTYESQGFCEANKDTLFKDLIVLMQTTTNPFIKSLFPEDTTQDDRKRPTTAGSKIITQANDLVTTLMKAVPHYVRCIKPNESKRPKDWDPKRVEHQVRYLNLEENIRIRRAGFAYRQLFEKFLKRFAILTRETFPTWRGDPRQGVQHLMAAVNMERDQWQLGKQKVFIKSPESLFLLEELRERKYHGHARAIQRAYRRWKSQKYFIDMRQKASDIMFGRKERKRFSLNRNFVGDYINYADDPTLKSLVGSRNEKLEFGHTITKYDRRFKAAQWDLIVTNQNIFLIGIQKVESGPEKGRFFKVVKRKLPIGALQGVSLSTKADDFVVLHVPNEYDSIIETVLKTELVTVLSEKYMQTTGRQLSINFSDSIQFTVKKTKWEGKGVKKLNFVTDNVAKFPMVKPGGGGGVVNVPPGLPRDSRPVAKQYTGGGGRSGGGGGNKGGFGGPQKSYGGAPQAAPQGFGGPQKSYGGAPQAAPQGYGGAAPQGFGAAPQQAQGGFGGPRGPGPMAAGGPARPAMAAPAAKPKLPQFRAIYPYNAVEADELSLEVGDIVSVTNQDNEGWWTGTSKGRKGLFPANYVQPC